MSKFNFGVWAGLLAFLIWGSVSSWWYICQIKGFCDSTEVILAPDAKVAPGLNPPKEEVATATELITFVPIELSFSGIQFSKNSKLPSDYEILRNWLNEITDTLNTASISVTIIGHTCDLGTTEHNHQLGMARAMETRQLIEKMSDLTMEYKVASRGELEPLADNVTEEARAQNRRVEIVLKTRKE